MEKIQRGISYFVSFCVEHYKHAKQLTGGEAMALEAISFIKAKEILL